MDDTSNIANVGDMLLMQTNIRDPRDLLIENGTTIADVMDE